MAILTVDQLKEKMKGRFGESDSEEDISFVEDITDTVESLSQNQDNGYKAKYDELKKKYRDRFFNGSSSQEDDKDEPDEKDVNKLSFESLFTKK